jgi:cell division protein FtsQ
VGNSEVSRPELLAIFGEDIGRNIFFVPLEDRRKQMEALPWIAHATVMRLMPDQLRIAVTERTPVAFVHNGSRAGLVDGEGVLLDMPPKAAEKHYSFPVITGINESEPLSTRAARMKIYERFVHDLDATGEHVSSKLSEVDLSDPEDVRAVIADGDRSLLIHFGDENFLERYHGYQAHLAEWRQQYPRLAAVDARYDTQFVLEMTPGRDGSAEKPATDAATSAPVKSDAAPPAKKPLAAPHKSAPRHTKAKASVKSARQLTLQQLRQQRQMEQR